MQCEVQSQSAAQGAKDGDPLLEVRVTIGQQLGKNIGQVMLVNKSTEFLCISERVFDPQFQRVLLKRKDGSYIGLRSTADPAINVFLGFDYTDAYLFVMPAEKKKIDFDLMNFVVQPGRYDYEMTFSYYRCTDVIDNVRIKSRRTIPSFGIQATGEVSIPKEEQ